MNMFSIPSSAVDIVRVQDKSNARATMQLYCLHFGKEFKIYFHIKRWPFPKTLDLQAMTIFHVIRRCYIIHTKQKLVPDPSVNTVFACPHNNFLTAYSQVLALCQFDIDSSIA